MKPSIPKGTRDFSPQEMVKRNYIFDTIRSVYQRYGYLPIETPSMENTETLMGKYGEEGDRLIFRVLESGDFTKEIQDYENVEPNIKNKIEGDLDNFKLYVNKKLNEIIKQTKEEELLAYDFQTVLKKISGFEPYDKSKKVYTDFFRILEESFLEFITYPDTVVSIKTLDGSIPPDRITRWEFYIKSDEKTRIFQIDFHFDYFLNKSPQSKGIINFLKKLIAFTFAIDYSKKVLRNDLTVPFGRYVVMHRNEITFPFKRYQIQPVWRADRPQKGRYREFYQCDADVIGSNSLLNEVELIQIIDEVFSKLKVGVTIKINNRKILSGIAEVIGEKDKIIDITVAIDKLDKVGADGVNKELQEKGISQTALIKLQPLISFKGSNNEKLALLKKMLAGSEIGKKGIEEVEYLFGKTSNVEHRMPNVELDITLARGLNYYTGAIIEVKVNHTGSTFTGSICGGGRYDDLTGIFGLLDVSGVGISFGADRIYDVLEELKLFPDSASASTKVLVINFGAEEENYALQIARQLREAGINTELYPDAAKLKKQFAYADANKIPFVITAGKDEIEKGIVALKNMSSGEQNSLSLQQAIERLA